LEASVELVPEETFTRVGFVGGFNRKWGMPLPQRYAARAGSVYTFEAKTAISQSKFQVFLEQGIGERRAEGFGRIALLPTPLDHPLHSGQESTQDTPQTDPWLRGSRLMEAAQGQEQGTTMRTMAERMLRHRLEKALIKEINELAPSPSLSISNAQLSTIRALVRQARLSGEISPIRQRLTTMKKQARDQFERVRIEKQSLEQWLNDRLDEAENPAQAWQRFDKDNPPAVWDEEMAREFILRLIDGVLDMLQNPIAKKGGEG
jgi:CRISPR-associated protein Csx10